MSFVQHKDCAEEGDTVIVYLNFNLFYAVVLKAGETFQTKYGALRHNDMIGKPYGSRIAVKNGFVHFLWPTPELWTLSLPHRTQILYGRDISLTIFQLDLKPGSVVIESGTGSGSLTHSLARAVAPTGKVFTFDFHQVRSETAHKEFVSHGIDDIVHCAHRDVCADGFGLENVADAVFLDLPHPWLAVEHAIKSLKNKGGRICSFSPCIEQVQRTCQRLREFRCVEINTLECLERPYEVRKVRFVKQSTPNGNSAKYFVGPDGDSEQSGSDQMVAMDTQEDAENGEEETEENEKPKRSRSTKEQKRDDRPGEDVLTATASLKIPGHTGYLTFATYLGDDCTEKQDELNEK